MLSAKDEGMCLEIVIYVFSDSRLDFCSAGLSGLVMKEQVWQSNCNFLDRTIKKISLGHFGHHSKSYELRA